MNGEQTNVASRVVADVKTDFLTEATLMLAWAASVQRAGIYRQGPKPESSRVKDFRRSLCAYVTGSLLPSYAGGCDPTRHCVNLEGLVAYGSSIGQDVLEEVGYKLGVAQKLLNLFLKYQWCLDRVAEPPHCPIDRIVLQKTRFRDKLNWTEITKFGSHKDVMKEIEDIATRQGLSIAEWELRTYSSRSSREMRTPVGSKVGAGA